jgi:hypothetical protein
MKRRKLAAWISLSAALGAGVGLLWWTHGHARAHAEQRRAQRIEPHRDRLQEIISSGETGQNPTDSRSRANGIENLSRIASNWTAPSATRSPALPSRVLPGPLPGAVDVKFPEPALSLPTPPVPTKTLPEPIPGDLRYSSEAATDSDLPEQN